VKRARDFIKFDKIWPFFDFSAAAPSSRVGKSIRYEFDLNELLFIKLLTEFPFSLPKEDKHSPPARGQIFRFGGAMADARAQSPDEERRTVRVGPLSSLA
jgi:hypothetical protein